MALRAILVLAGILLSSVTPLRAHAEQSWLQVLEMERDTALAAQSHFGLAGLYRKQGQTAQAQHEMQDFQKLQGTIGPHRSE